MQHCIVCGQVLPGAVACGKCGFDPRCDYERYRTLVSALPEGATPIYLYREKRVGGTVSAEPQAKQPAPAKTFADMMKSGSKWSMDESGEQRAEQPANRPSQGAYTKWLRYGMNMDCTWSVMGLGDATDTDLVIPDRYDGLPVTEIGKQAFSGFDGLTSIVIPKSVTSIGKNAFHGCGELSFVFFGGSVAEWHRVTVDSGNAPLKDAVKYCYAEEKPPYWGYYWHWVDGVPTVW